jgi:transposase-like protein
MAKDKEEDQGSKYVVEDLAEKLGITPQSARVFLRSIEHERTGRSYGWDTAAELDSLVKQYNARKKESSAEPPAKAKVPNKKRKEAA